MNMKRKKKTGERGRKTKASHQSEEHKKSFHLFEEDEPDMAEYTAALARCMAIIFHNKEE